MRARARFSFIYRCGFTSLYRVIFHLSRTSLAAVTAAVLLCCCAARFFFAVDGHGKFLGRWKKLCVRRLSCRPNFPTEPMHKSESLHSAVDIETNEESTPPSSSQCACAHQQRGITMTKTVRFPLYGRQKNISKGRQRIECGIVVFLELLLPNVRAAT